MSPGGRSVPCPGGDIVEQAYVEDLARAVVQWRFADALEVTRQVEQDRATADADFARAMACKWGTF